MYDIQAIKSRQDVLFRCIPDVYKEIDQLMKMIRFHERCAKLFRQYPDTPYYIYEAIGAGSELAKHRESINKLKPIMNQSRQYLNRLLIEVDDILDVLEMINKT